MNLHTLLFSTSTTSTTINWNALFLRTTLALVMWPHGAQLLLGWFNGYGFSATMEYFTLKAGLPYLIALMVIGIEFFMPLLLLAGLLTRFAACSMFIIVTGMIFSGHWEHGFFMNWFGNQQGEGIEYHLLLLGICMALIISGSGKYSADHLFTRK